MEHHLYLNIHITPKTSNQEFCVQDSRIVASVFINNVSKAITITDNTQLLLNNINGLFGGVDITDLGNYLQETKEFIRCHPKYSNEDMKNAFIISINEYNETRKDNIKLFVS